MTIAVDLRSLLQNFHSGVQEYTIQLLEALWRQDPDNHYVLISSGWKDAIQPASFRRYIQALPQVQHYHLKLPNKILNVCWRFLKRPLLESLVGKIDILFAPNFALAPFPTRVPVVITFHDLSFEAQAQFFSWKRRLWHQMARPRDQAQKAHKIIAVSQSTKNDLIELFDISAAKIQIIYSGIASCFRPLSKDHPQLSQIQNKYRLPRHFILSLGTLEPRKNIVSLISAFERLKRQTLKSKAQNLKLVLAGPVGWESDSLYKQRLKSSLKGEILFPGPIAPQDRVYVYNLAKVFSYPSFFEGFGFPPLEAMACGVPTIVSNRSSLSEAVGRGAIMVDPHKVEELTKALFQVLTDKALREYLATQGQKQAAQFTWARTARQTLEVFKKAAT